MGNPKPGRTGLALIAGLIASSSAYADMSACGSAYRKESVDQQIHLYTLCLTQGDVRRGNIASAFTNRGIAYFSKGDTDRALKDLDKSIQYEPRYAYAYQVRGLIHVVLGHLDLAEADFDASFRHQSKQLRDPAFANRGLVRMSGGRCADALDDFSEALERNRNLAWSYAAKSWLLSTCPDGQWRDGVEALRLAQTALSLREHWKFHDALAAAYAEQGRFEDSIREVKLARTMIDTDAPGSPWSKGLLARLALYEMGRPYREAASDDIAAEWLPSRSEEDRAPPPIAIR